MLSLAGGAGLAHFMDSTDEQPADPLSQLQLRIARRADELVRDSPFATSLNLHCWLIAEAELVVAPAAITKSLSGYNREQRSGNKSPH